MGRESPANDTLPASRQMKNGQSTANARQMAEPEAEHMPGGHHHQEQRTLQTDRRKVERKRERERVERKASCDT